MHALVHIPEWKSEIHAELVVTKLGAGIFSGSEKVVGGRSNAVLPVLLIQMRMKAVHWLILIVVARLRAPIKEKTKEEYSIVIISGEILSLYLVAT